MIRRVVSSQAAPVADHALSALRANLPVSGRTVEIRTDADGNQFFRATLALDDPRDVVLRARTPGQRPHFGMRDFAVEVYLPSAAPEAAVDLATMRFVAVVEIDDDTPEEGGEQPADSAPPNPEPHPVPNPDMPETTPPAHRQAARDARPPDSYRPPDPPTPAAPSPSRRAGRAAAFAADRIVRSLRRSLRGTAHRLAEQRLKALLAVAVGGLLVVIVAVWIVQSSNGPPEADTSPHTPITAAPTADAAADLYPLLPPGYPTGACGPAAIPEGALAVVSCGRNVDPGGPVASTFTLARDGVVLDSIFYRVLNSSTQVNCPGNIQSPGPWRRKASRERAEGTLYCGNRDGGPLVAWTNDPELVVSVVESGPAGPSLEQLYRWWASHS